MTKAIRVTIVCLEVMAKVSNLHTLRLASCSWIPLSLPKRESLGIIGIHFYVVRCPLCHPTNVRALKGTRALTPARENYPFLVSQAN